MPPFSGISRPFVEAYRGFGRYSSAATAGAAASALLIPALLRSDERGYTRTAAVTTPLIAAGYVAAPGMLSSVSESARQFRDFISTAGLRWQDYPKLNDSLAAAGERVRSALADTLARKRASFYAGVASPVENTTLAANEALNKIRTAHSDRSRLAESIRAVRSQMRNGMIQSPDQMQSLIGRWNELEGQRRFLSHASYEARMKAITPEEAVSSGDILPKPLPFEEIAARLEQNLNRPEYARVMSRRVEQAARVKLGAPVRWTQRDVRHFESLDVSAALNDLQMSKAGHYIRKAERLQAWIDAGTIGSRTRIAYALKDGKRERPVGALLFNRANDEDRVLVLPFTHEDSSMVFMGAGFRQRGLATGRWDEAGKYAADDYVLSHLGRQWGEVERSIQSSFQYGGINDPSDPIDAWLHSEFGDAVLPDWAINMRQGRYRPGEFGGFGSDGSRRFEDLSLEERTAVIEKQHAAGMTWIGSEGKVAEGYLQDAKTALLSPEMYPSRESQDAFYRSMTKPMYFEPATIQGLAKMRVENEALQQLAGHAQSELPLFQARVGMVSPQMRSLLGDLPEEYLEQGWSKDWWSSNIGKTYEDQARTAFRDMMSNPTDEAVEATVEEYKRALATDPDAALAARKFGTLGEMTVVADENAYRGVAGRMDGIVNLEEFDLKNWKDFNGKPLPKETVIGYKGGVSPVVAKANTFINQVEQTQDGWAIYTHRKFDFPGAKISLGYGGPKGMVTGGNTEAMVRLHNRLASRLDRSWYLPEDAQMLTMNTVSSLKSKTHYSDLMENAAELAVQLVETPYTESAKQRASAFIDELTAGGFAIHSGNRIGFNPLKLGSEAERIAHVRGFSQKAQSFLDEVGGMAADIEHPVFQAYQKTRGLGSKLSLSEYMNRAYGFMPVMMWDHSAVNIPSKVKITTDMLNEMERSGMPEGIADVLGNTLRPKGDPAMTWQMAEHLRGRDFTRPVGEALPIADIPIPQGKIKVDDRTGPSVFNPYGEKVQENFSVDLGTTLRDVEFGGNKADVRYLPKLGMKAYLGGPNQHQDLWQATDLEKSYNRVLQSAEALRLAPNQQLLNQTRGRASEYLNLLTSSMVGKEGVLRAEGIHQDAAYGVVVPRSMGPGGSNPYDILLSNEALGQFGEETQAAIKHGEDVFGVMFRDPVSAAYYVRYRYDKRSMLDPFEVGVDASLSGPYQMDHDKDMIKLVAFRNEQAAREARQAIFDANSHQNLNLQASRAFQGLEDPRAITTSMMEGEFAEKGWLKEKSWIARLAADVDADRLAAKRSVSIRTRLTSGYIGRYSNATTRLNLMLANNPMLRPGDADHALLNKLNYFVRQVPLSASKGKMNLGKEPEALLNELNSSMALGEPGAERTRAVLQRVAKEAGFKTVYHEDFEKLFGLKGTAGEVLNLEEQYLASDRGLGAVRKMLSNPHRSEINRVSSMLVSGNVSPEGALRMLDSAAAGNTAGELLGGIAKQGARQPDWVRAAGRLFGHKVGSAAEDMSHTMGALNQAIKETVSGGRGGFKGAGKTLALGAGVAAVAGLLTTSTRSSNGHRPEEKMAVSDHVPGEAIAGIRSSVNPKRIALPAPRTVKTMMVAPMHQANDIEVRAKAPDRQGQMEVAKLVERVSGGSGYNNVTVNRVGGWKDSVSKHRLREQIRDELTRY